MLLRGAPKEGEGVSRHGTQRPAGRLRARPRGMVCLQSTCYRGSLQMPNARRLAPDSLDFPLRGAHSHFGSDSDMIQGVFQKGHRDSRDRMGLQQRVRKGMGPPLGVSWAGRWGAGVVSRVVDCQGKKNRKTLRPGVPGAWWCWPGRRVGGSESPERFEPEMWF